MKKILSYLLAFACVAATDALVIGPALAESSRFAQVEVETPGELLLGKIQHARVAVTLHDPAAVMVVTARTEGRGLSLPLKRQWRFVKVSPGRTTEFKVPYQLAKSFQTGEVHFDISTYEVGGKASRKPANQQSAVLRLKR